MAQDNGTREGLLFRSRLLNSMARIHPTVPSLLLCPVILVFVTSAVLALESLLASVFYVVLGYMVWTLTEYWVHRLVFHFTPRSRWGQQLHWMIHGAHHDQPDDPRRLVMLSLVTAPVAVFVSGVFCVLLGTSRGYAAAAGFIAGYVVYDVLHFHLHNDSPSTTFGRRLRSRHLRHHFRDERRGFGVSCPYWDHVFGTAISLQRRSAVRHG